MVSAAFMVPAFTGNADGSTAGNPYTDVNGTWGAYQVELYTTTSSWTLLPWNSTWGFWVNGNAQFWPGEMKIRDDDATNPGVLAFTPAVAGKYSVDGTVSFYSSGYQTGVLDVYTVSSSGTWIRQDVYFGDNGVPVAVAIHDLMLTPSDTLVFAARSRSGGGAFAEVRGLDGLTFVPEPATMALLAIGGIAAMRRRK
jgi:hypothetical protein